MDFDRLFSEDCQAFGRINTHSLLLRCGFQDYDLDHTALEKLPDGDGLIEFLGRVDVKRLSASAGND